jgi:hypothetical protein
VLELLEAKEEVLIGLPVRDPGATQALLHGGIHQPASPRRALARPAQDVRDDGPAFLALYPTLLDQAVDDLLNPLTGSGGGAYLQEDQPLQRLKHNQPPDDGVYYPI